MVNATSRFAENQKKFANVLKHEKSKNDFEQFLTHERIDAKDNSRKGDNKAILNIL